MQLVVIESPYAGDVDANVRYAKECFNDCLKRGEAPYASHLLFTQPGLLDDTVPSERKLGMEAGFAWGDRAHLRAVYTDLGITPGMNKGIERALSIGQRVEYRSIK